jgi:hypothetical protein
MRSETQGQVIDVERCIGSAYVVDTGSLNHYYQTVNYLVSQVSTGVIGMSIRDEEAGEIVRNTEGMV